MKKTAKGWKLFNCDEEGKLYCRPGNKTDYFEKGEWYSVEGEIEFCKNGFHFHENIADLNKYYSLPGSTVCEITCKEVLSGADKSVCRSMKITKILNEVEKIRLVNSGRDNTGIFNSGNNNSGAYNRGNWNSGDHNSGNNNSGDYNSGDWNRGNYNSGNNNRGNSNSGDHNSRNWNSGNHNSGNWNSGNHNSGYHNSGDRNSGGYNRGYYNSGGYNSGDHNSGDHNSGSYNSGNNNRGNSNSGDHNSGSYNSGDHNSGNNNSGDHNSGNWNACFFSCGALNTITPKFVKFFNKELDLEKYMAIKYPSFMLFKLTTFVASDDMSEKEKKDHPDHVVTRGYLKPLGYKQAFTESFLRADPSEAKQLVELPNFDYDIFEEISGISKEMIERKLKG